MTCRLPPLTLAALSTAVSSAAAQSYRAEASTAAPPQEITASLRAALSEQAIRVTGPGGILCEIWFRKEIPATAATQTLGVAYPNVVQGTLLGTIRFAGPASDYRNRAVKAGVYTMRYALHPVDGNHMGVAPQRDFLLLSPVADDTTTAERSFDDLLALSRKASGTTHPSVWSLVPPEDAPASLPALAERKDEGLWVLYATVRMASQGGQASELRLALVVLGHAPEA